MTDRDAFIADICESPDDDAPRLQYADWLEENGEGERATFIRMSIERFRNPFLQSCENSPKVTHAEFEITKNCRCASCSYSRRMWNIWRHNGCDWDGEIYRIVAEANIAKFGINGVPLNANPMEPAISTTWERGFVSGIECGASQWLTHGPAIVREHPVTRVEVSDARPHRGRFDRYAETVPVEHRGAEYWIWEVQSENTASSNFLPYELYKHLARPMSRWHCQYPTEAAARSALSEAALLWAKSQKPASTSDYLSATPIECLPAASDWPAGV